MRRPFDGKGLGASCHQSLLEEAEERDSLIRVRSVWLIQEVGNLPYHR